MTYMCICPRPSIKTLVQGFIKFTILLDPSLVIITIYIICLIHVRSSVDKKRRNLTFSLYGHAPAQEPLPRGSRFTIL